MTNNLKTSGSAKIRNHDWKLRTGANDIIVVVVVVFVVVIDVVVVVVARVKRQMREF